MFRTLSNSLEEVRSYTRRLFGKKYILSDCTLLYFSKKKSDRANILKLLHILLLLTDGTPIGQPVIWEEPFLFISGQ